MMIRFKYIFFSFLLIMASACSNDDDSGSDDDPGQENPFSGDFFPSGNTENEWNFEVVEVDNQNGDIANTEDRLFVQTTNSSNFTFGVNTNGNATGTMNGILTSGTLSKTDTTLATTGQISLAIDGLEDINIPYEDAILYNLQATDGAELSSTSGTFTQDIQSFPVTINYVLKTAQVKNLNAITLNGKEYSDVNQSTFIVTITIVLDFPGLSEPLPVVDEQESITINNYFAKDIGLVHAVTETSVIPNSDTIAIIETLPDVDASQIPSEISTTNTQNLDTFTVN